MTHLVVVVDLEIKPPAYVINEHGVYKLHLNAKYFYSFSGNVKDEILGVIIHELVHVYQFNGYDTAPGAMIEGIADYVRLKSGYCPIHWKKKRGHHWSEGYEKCAYFLEWIEDVKGITNAVQNLNLEMKDKKFETAWKDSIRISIEELWREYERYL